MSRSRPKSPRPRRVAEQVDEAAFSLARRVAGAPPGAERLSPARKLLAVVFLVLAIPFELGFGAVMVVSLLYPSTDPHVDLGWSVIGYAIGLLAALLMAIASVLAIRSLVGELRGRPSRPLRGRRLIGWILSLAIGLPCLVIWLGHLPEDWEGFLAWMKPTPLLLAFLLAPWIAWMEEEPEPDEELESDEESESAPQEHAPEQREP